MSTSKKDRNLNLMWTPYFCSCWVDASPRLKNGIKKMQLIHTRGEQIIWGRKKHIQSFGEQIYLTPNYLVIWGDLSFFRHICQLSKLYFYQHLCNKKMLIINTFNKKKPWVKRAFVFSPEYYICLLLISTGSDAAHMKYFLHNKD